MAESPEPELDLIAVGAHPDDVEIACGGTLARLARKGYAVGIVDLTDGEPTPHSPGPEVRLAEAERAAEILGVATADQPEHAQPPAVRLRSRRGSRWPRCSAGYKPKVVIGFGGKTVLASPDHYQAMLITDAAVFYSRLTKWDEYFDGLPTHTIVNQLSFPIALHGLDLPEASGYIVADIGSTLEVKLEAIRCVPDPVSRQQGRDLSWRRGHESISRLDGGFRGGRGVHDLSLRRRRRPDAVGQPGACSTVSAVRVTRTGDVER